MSTTHAKKSAATTTPPETPATPSPAPIVQPPPANAIPPVPAGFVPIDITYYTGILPKGAQLAVLAAAVGELKNFPDYAEVFGKTAPPYEAVVQAFGNALLWSDTRAKLDAFDIYAATQEALAWKGVHDFMARMRPAFELAVKSDSTVGTQRPSLVSLFGAQGEIAKKAAATRKANNQLKAEGKLPVKGKAGKRRKSAAAKKLLAAAGAEGASAPAEGAGASAATPAPAATTARA